MCPFGQKMIVFPYSLEKVHFLVLFLRYAIVIWILRSYSLSGMRMMSRRTKVEEEEEQEEEEEEDWRDWKEEG